ncbi:MAG: RNA methyltransferase [Deltaproteobacteria bacterium]|jgi:23S rRNA (guanosine2251-2'-O)-methyltransferase|nr:RNA methyltransferase [Deltaproteobacteria bacterium]
MTPQKPQASRAFPPGEGRRDEEPALVLPGVKAVLELLEREPARIDMLFLRKGLRSPESAHMLDLCRSVSVRFSLVESRVLDALCRGARHQGVAARLLGKAGVSLDELLTAAHSARLPLILALDRIQDTGNAGVLARSLHALGGAGLIVPRHNSAYLGQGAMRASAGALNALPVCKAANLGRALEEAREAGIRVYGAGLHTGSANALTAKVLTPAVLVLGNEENGIRPGVAKHCDELLHIPMRPGVDSLNVAQAGAMLLACFARALAV